MFDLSGRVIAIGLGALFIIAALTFGVRQCELRRDRAAQARVDASQAQAGADSGKDAIGTVAAAGGREAASEAMGRQNERDIRAADGASDPVKPAVRDAGLSAICRRKSYENDPKCSQYRAK